VWPDAGGGLAVAGAKRRTIGLITVVAVAVAVVATVVVAVAVAVAVEVVVTGAGVLQAPKNIPAIRTRINPRLQAKIVNLLTTIFSSLKLD
jgi:uncharacterized membrane protein